MVDSFGTGHFLGMLGELVVQTSFIAFKSNSKWHEEFIRVLGFVKLRSILEYVMEFVPLFLVAISAAGKLHLSRGRNRLPLRGQCGGRWSGVGRPVHFAG